MFWVNGKPTNSIPVTDRSFQYGDGCFTTMLTRKGEIQHWSLHVERMEACLTQLEISSPNWESVLTMLEQAALPDEKAGLKLHISRGDGGRGYSPALVDSPNITVGQFSFPNHYETIQSQGIELGVCEKRLGHSPMLAGHKHNNRLEQILLKSEMDKNGFLDGLTLDIEDNVVETTMANIFWKKNKKWYTPALDKAGVSGVMRKLVLSKLSSKGLEVESGQFKLHQALEAEELFITNSILTVAPVTKIGNQCFQIGQMTRSIQEYFTS